MCNNSLTWTSRAVQQGGRGKKDCILSECRQAIQNWESSSTNSLVQKGKGTWTWCSFHSLCIKTVDRLRPLPRLLAHARLQPRQILKPNSHRMGRVAQLLRLEFVLLWALPLVAVSMEPQAGEIGRAGTPLTLQPLTGQQG